MARILPVAACGVNYVILGGYLFTLRTLLRAVMNFELSPITWLRAAVHILSGSIIALLLYRTLGGTPYLSDVLQITGTPDGEPLRLWLAVAFIAGYVPDFGLSTLVRYLHITYLKNVDDAVMKSVAIIPIEIVDGIDYDVRYRLEETNIVDIQNLATYNPILLFVETPYGLYEAFDWVLQAQLCLAIGPKTFLELKKYKVRTIFDLEKAVTGAGTDGLTRMIGAVLYTDADPEVRKMHRRRRRQSQRAGRARRRERPAGCYRHGRQSPHPKAAAALVGDLQPAHAGGRRRMIEPPRRPTLVPRM
jgi:hypothetical protein